MSTDAMAPVAENGTGKNRDGSDKKSKKRKHEAEKGAADTAQAGETPAKKQRKDKKPKEDLIDDTVSPMQPEGNVAKEKKKGKKNRQEGAELAEATAKAEANLTKDQKKGNKKRKRKDLDDTSREAEEETEDAASSREKAISATPQAPPTTTVKTAFDGSQLVSHSPFVRHTASLYLPLAPIAHDFALEGLCAEHLSPLLLTYFAPLKGVVLTYGKPRLSEHPVETVQEAKSHGEARTVLSKSVDEYAVTYVWLTAEFVLFRPSRGTVLEGYVGLQNESILGVMCYNYFNAGIERHRLPQDWKWVPGDEGERGRGRKKPSAATDGGYFVDGGGDRVAGRVLFRVTDFEASPQSESGVGSINIHGTLLTEDEERKMRSGS